MKISDTSPAAVNASAAEAAKNRAENAADSAENAKANAEAASTAALQSKLNAQAAESESQTAKGNILNFVTLSETSKNQAEVASTTAVNAKASAEAASTAALQAKLNAQAAESESQTAKGNILNFITLSETAKGKAEVAAEASEAAQVNTEAAEQAAIIAKESTESLNVDSQIIRDNIGNLEIASKAAQIKAEAAASESEAAKNQTQSELEQAVAARIEAVNEAEKAAQAHNMSTTAGLAGAFNEKAKSATLKQTLWGVALAATLIIIALIAWQRFEAISTLISKMIAGEAKLVSVSIVIIEVILSISSIAAPIWFAWLSTGMVSKYFHLAEDYSYKTAIAKAYVGFKKEAENLDPIFQERLFAAAITQLDSNPLRFFESSSHPGSPIQDLLQQPFMKAALEDSTFKDAIVNWFKKTYKTNFPVPKIDININTTQPTTDS